MSSDATTVQSGAEDDGYLYQGWVHHRRFRPRKHHLRYRVFSVLVDVDQLDALADRLRWFSFDRFNLVSIHRRDFTASENVSLRASVQASLTETGIATSIDRLYLSCYPRLFGYAFNPLSLFYCHDVEGQLFCVVHEVHNTHGERIRYTLPVDTETDASTIEQETDKAMFVSPFAPMNLHYRFRLNRPAAQQRIHIEACDNVGPLVVASYNAERQPLNDRQLLRAVLRMPWMTLKVTAGIHWEALKLLLKRVPWHRHVSLARLRASSDEFGLEAGESNLMVEKTAGSEQRPES